MQVILLEKVANLGNLGDVVKVKDGYARNFLIPTARGAARHRGGDQGVRGQARRAREGRRREARRRAGAGREDERPHRPHHAEGRRRRAAVRLGHQRRHRRCAQPHRLQGREGAGAHAERPAEDGRRAHRDGGAAHATWSSRSRSWCWARRTLTAPLRTGLLLPASHPSSESEGAGSFGAHLLSAPHFHRRARLSPALSTGAARARRL